MQNEFQNAYQTSQALQRQTNAYAVPEGMFAVVECSLAYCQFTDATLPNPDRRVVRCYGSRRIAEHVAARKNAELAELYAEDGGCEAWYEVSPKLPRPVLIAAPIDDEIPF